MRTSSLIALVVLGFFAGCQSSPPTRHQRGQVHQALHGLKSAINTRSFEALEPYLSPEATVAGLPPEMSRAGIRQGMLWTRHKVEDIQLLSLQRPGGEQLQARIVLYMGAIVMQQLVTFDAAGKITAIQSEPIWKETPVAMPSALKSDFVVSGRLMFVRVTVNGRNGFMLFDTGASGLLLNKRYFPPKAEQGMQGISATVAGLKKRLGHAEVSSLKWGSLHLKNIQGELHDFSRMENPSIAPLLGAISHNEVKNSAVVMHWQDKTIEVFATAKDGKRKASGREASSGTRFPFSYFAHLPVIPAQIGEKTVPFVFDSGAELNVLPDLTGMQGHFHTQGFVKISDGAQSESAPAPAGIIDRTEVRGLRSLRKFCRRLIALSSAFRNILTDEYGIDPQRVAVIPGGVDLERFRPSSPIEARSKMGWPSDKRIIFCIRRLVNRMGLEHLLDAFALISASHPDTLLIIAGKGPLSEELQKYSVKLGLENRVKFAGYIADEELPVAYAAAEFSIVPSQALEGFGLITVESLACGTPVLVTPVGGLPETVRNLDASLILEGCTTEAIAAGLVRGLSQPLPSRDECRRHAEQNFSWSGVARRVFAVYEEAAHDPLH